METVTLLHVDRNLFEELNFLISALSWSHYYRLKSCFFLPQRFIMLLTEHLVRCETGSVDISTPWYKNCIERLQQIFLMVNIHTHTHTPQQYMSDVCVF